jgi:hypothetical protein
MCCRDYYLMDGRAAADLTLNEVIATPEILLITENYGLSVNRRCDRFCNYRPVRRGCGRDE